MPQVETLPQSIAEVKTIVLKPRIDQGDLRVIAEKIKPSLFSRFGFKSRLEDVRLLASEAYFEPYLIIAGKYVLDYCRKHVFEVNVKETTTKIYVAGQEFRSEQSDPKLTNKVIKMIGEEHAHHERQGYYILDRMKREIPPERLPISPFIAQKDNSSLNSSFKCIKISDAIQIEFLKGKIARRPADVAEIIREIFDITDRTIAYYPMYQLTFENAKNRQDATITVNGITGEIMLNGTKKLAVKTIFAFDESEEKQLTRETAYEETQTEPMPNISHPEIPDNRMNTLKEENAIQPTQPIETIYERKQTEPILNIHQPDTKGKTRSTPEEEIIESPQPEEETTAYEERRLETTPKITKPDKTDNTKTIPKEELVQSPQLETEEAPYEEAQTEPIVNINQPETTNETETIPKEQETMILGFPAIIHGKVLASDDKVEVIVGDVEIPSGTNINKTLVIKGTLKIGSNCRAHGKLKVLKDITVGADTIVDGDIVSGGNIYVGPRSLIAGSVKAAGVFEIEEDALVEGIFARTDPSQ